MHCKIEYDPKNVPIFILVTLYSYFQARYDQNSTTKPILPVTQDYTNRKNANSSQISILLQDNLAQEDHIKYFPAYMNGNISHPASMYSNGNVRNSNVTFTL